MKVEFRENKTENELQSKARVKVSNDRNEKNGRKNDRNDRINRNYRCDKKFPLQNGRMTLLIDL